MTSNHKARAYLTVFVLVCFLGLPLLYNNLIPGLLLRDQLGFLFPYTVYVEPSSYHDYDFDFEHEGAVDDHDYRATEYYPQNSYYNQYVIQ